MKNFSLYLFVFLLSASLLAQENTYNLKKENLKAKVQSVFHKTFKVSKSSGELSQKYAIKQHYNVDGNLTEIENFGHDDILDSKEVFYYNDDKLMSIRIENSTGRTGKITSFQYNREGVLLSQEKMNNKQETEHKTVYLYNDVKQLLSKTKTIPSINYSMTERYVYDNRTGQIIVKNKKARIGTSKETYEYNTRGLISKKSEYNAVSELFSVITYEYNAENDKINLKKYDAKGKQTYDESYEYTYDKSQNWIKRVSYHKGVKASVETRVFVYY